MAVIKYKDPTTGQYVPLSLLADLIEVVDGFTSTSTSSALSANSGRILNEKFSQYLPLTGGSIDGNITATNFIGNATSATKLITARTINGVAFDGTQDITITAEASDPTKLPLTGGTLTGNLIVPYLENTGNWLWSAPNNIFMKATANDQEWSFDLGIEDAVGTTSNYTGTYAQFWSGKNSNSIIRFYNDDMSVHIPNGNLHVGGAVYANNGVVAYNPIHFANSVLNPVGDDVYIGDQDIAGTLVIKGANGATSLAFAPYSGSVTQTFSTDGSGNMSLNGNFSIGGNITAGNIIAFPNTGSNAGTWRGIVGYIGDNDDWVIRGSQNSSNDSFLEIATGDDGMEPILVRQYSGSYASAAAIGANVARTAYLLDGSGNTSFPGTVSAPTFSGNLSGNASTATQLADWYGYVKSGAWNIDSWENSTLLTNSFMGSVYHTAQSTWYNIINIRHRGGGSDGNSYGMQIVTSLTANHKIIEFRKNYGSGAWTSWSNFCYSDDKSVRNVYMNSISTWNSYYSGYPAGTVMFCWE